MTCVLGMVVRREREIRDFVKTPFYRVLSTIDAQGHTFEGEWRAVKGSRYFESYDLYKENGFKERKKAEELIQYLQTPDDESVNVAGIQGQSGLNCRIESIEKKKEKKNPPLLYNLAELQNDCSKRFKISPDETLRIVQELYEKKLVTYPRTDARVLSTAVAKEITRNLNGLSKYPMAAPYMQDILNFGSYKTLAKTRYVNDKQITDHYAIIPTGQGLNALSTVSSTAKGVYDLIVRRFLSIFYPPAVYQKVAIVTKIKEESFFSSFKVLAEEGYLKVAGIPKKKASQTATKDSSNGNSENNNNDTNDEAGFRFFRSKPGHRIVRSDQVIKEGCSPSGQSIGYQRRRDITSEALQFRFHDPGNGECRTADRGRRTSCPDQRKRNRNKCDKSRDSEKACEYQVSRIEQEDTGDHTDAAGRDDL